MRALLYLGITLAMAPLGALYTGWVYSRVWNWFIAQQYGPGPSYESWYGIGVLTSLVMAVCLLGIPKRGEGDTSTDDQMEDFLKRSVMFYVVMAGMLGFCWCVGQVLGWI